MAILTYVSSLINNIIKTGDEYFCYGPTAIPNDHPYAGKKVHSWGKYKRRLLLPGGKVLILIIQRYYLVETGKTFSLLPFMISPYQRHPNKVIEEYIIKYFLEKKSLESISNDSTPSYKTVRRWVRKFKDLLNGNLLDDILKHLVRNHIEFEWPDTIGDAAEKVAYLFDTVKTHIANPASLEEAGVLSYINMIVNR